MEINNKQVKDIYDRWSKVWESEENTLESRLKAFSILKVIEALVNIYEFNGELDEEDVDDLFIAWNRDFKPVLPEERPETIARLREQLKRYR